ncbi:hypothetical protein A3C67_02390 [Candidatus Nomurabacteria bacterium RIFCSPHIGHO2_02_FULL_42_19]|uniref:Uncharacterized protein n=1 Tax=Candidatus Nomurabacteria bacterium RIFCSPHIGHO2_02_FULL_42_19 TaxID=1801756 RepID=A0A1F6W3V0_9BACT|nr:MAG: hypothetical protein A3C67_02390 [Candidatus Nomurabacteria bacterium RIFCSPHIGHO2_02_FULL_42_19]
MQLSFPSGRFAAFFFTKIFILYAVSIYAMADIAFMSREIKIHINLHCTAHHYKSRGNIMSECFSRDCEKIDMRVP